METDEHLDNGAVKESSKFESDANISIPLLSRARGMLQQDIFGYWIGYLFPNSYLLSRIKARYGDPFIGSI